MEYRRKEGAEERDGRIVFRLEKNEKESCCRNDDATENERENNSRERKEIMTSEKMGCRNKLFCPSPLPGLDLVSRL
jgi:hypothetical protein